MRLNLLKNIDLVEGGIILRVNANNLEELERKVQTIEKCPSIENAKVLLLIKDNL